MLGHQLWRSLHGQHDTWVTLRRSVADFAAHNLFDQAKVIQVDDITDDESLGRALDRAKPDAVINCVGLIKQRDEASDEALAVHVNTEFPHRLAKRHGFAPKRVSVRNQKTRWGSCSSNGAISLNWRLIQVPSFVRDYVILHELVHLDHLNHSDRFWKRLAKACPNHKAAEAWLKLCGNNIC